MPRAAAQQPHAELYASTAAAELVRAAERYIEHGANVFMNQGSQLVDAAKSKGCKFPLRIVLPDGLARLDVVTAEGESVRLFEIAIR